MMMGKTIFVFLTRAEIKIFNSSYLTIHLPIDDTRYKTISKFKKADLKLVVYNPDVKWLNRFFPDRWYLLDKLDFISAYKYSNQPTLSFNWRNTVRRLTDAEVYYFRKNHCLPDMKLLPSTDKIF